MIYIYIYKIFRLFRNFSIKDIDIYVEKTTDTQADKHAYTHADDTYAKKHANKHAVKYI